MDLTHAVPSERPVVPSWASVHARVVLRVGKARLDMRDQVARIGLRRRVLALLLLTQEGRQGDRGKDADDQNDDKELHEREAILVVRAIAQLVQHVPSKGDLFGCASASTYDGNPASSACETGGPWLCVTALTDGLPLRLGPDCPSYRPFGH